MRRVSWRGGAIILRQRPVIGVKALRNREMHLEVAKRHPEVKSIEEAGYVWLPGLFVQSVKSGFLWSSPRFRTRLHSSSSLYMYCTRFGEQICELKATHGSHVLPLPVFARPLLTHGSDLLCHCIMASPGVARCSDEEGQD
jgi:hypothetical protein